MPGLIDEQGQITFGRFDESVGTINYMDYALYSAMGRRRRWPAQKLLFKQFVFWGITSPDIIAGLAVVDLKYVANAFFYLYDKKKNVFWEAQKTGLPGRAAIDLQPDDGRARFRSKTLQIEFSRQQIHASSRHLEVALTCEPEQTRPLRLCTRTGYRGWTYTQKTAPIPVAGQLRGPEGIYHLTPSTSSALTDWTAGYLRRETFWNWAAATGVLPDGRRVALNLSCGVNETEASENVVWIQGTPVAMPQVRFCYNAVDLTEKWRIISEDGRVDLEFIPDQARTEKINAGLVASKFWQLAGHFSGILTVGQAGGIELAHLPGWVEEHFARW